MAQSSSITSEFSCAICMGLMVEPTTLTCGHSFCRHCLAKWYLTIDRKTCAQCRQIWSGHPQVNVTIRNLIERMHPDELALRKVTIDDTLKISLELMEFESRMKRTVQPSRPDPEISFRNLWKYAFHFCVFIICWLTIKWFFLSPSTEVLTHKPLAKWSPSDVQQWMGGLGFWSEEDVSVTLFDQLRVDGAMLFIIEEENIRELLPKASDFQQRAFWTALQKLTAEGRKLPSDFWEYKDSYFMETMFITALFPSAPRMIFVHLYLFHYHESFTPFIHTMLPAFGEIDATLPLQHRSIEWLQFGIFLITAVTCPHLLGIAFVVRMLWTTNAVISLLAMYLCSLSFLLDMLNFFQWLRLPVSHGVSLSLLFKGWCWEALTYHLGFILFYIVWFVIPGFISDLGFVGCVVSLLSSYTYRMYRVAFLHAPDWQDRWTP